MQDVRALPPHEGPEPGYIIVFVFALFVVHSLPGYQQLLIGPQLELPLAPVVLTTSTLVPTVGLRGAVWIIFGRDRS